jgi:hypothetical protein
MPHDMRFCVERNVLADEAGKIVPVTEPSRITYRWVEADNVSHALTIVADEERAEFVHGIYAMAPVQAMATVKRGRVVLTLHAFPEEEANERINHKATR